MPSNEELNEMPVIGARVDPVRPVLEYWQTTLLRQGSDQVYEQTLPARKDKKLALADVKFYAPDLPITAFTM